MSKISHSHGSLANLLNAHKPEICFAAVLVPALTVFAWNFLFGGVTAGALGVLAGATMIALLGLLALQTLPAMPAPIPRQDERRGAGQSYEDLLAGLERLAEPQGPAGSRPALQGRACATTGLINRAGFLDLAKAVCDRGQGAAVAFIAIDHYQRIRETFGPEETDRVTREVASRLTRSVRRSDIVARWSEERFVILFSGGRDDNEQRAVGADVLTRICERIRADVEAARIASADGRPLTISGGVARIGGQDGAVAMAVARADGLLSSARRSGPNQLALALVA